MANSLVQITTQTLPVFFSKSQSIRGPHVNHINNSTVFPGKNLRPDHIEIIQCHHPANFCQQSRAIRGHEQQRPTIITFINPEQRLLPQKLIIIPMAQYMPDDGIRCKGKHIIWRKCGHIDPYILLSLKQLTNLFPQPLNSLLNMLFKLCTIHGSTMIKMRVYL